MKTRNGNFWTSGALPLIEPEFLGSIISAASDIALVLSSEMKILSVLVNSTEESFGNLAHWEGRPIVEFLTSESVTKLAEAHQNYLSGVEMTRPLELNHSDNAVWQYPVRYTFHRFGSEDAVLLLGRDLRPIAETQQQLMQAQVALEQGYEARREFDARYRVMLGQVSDAVAFVTVATGRVEEANARAAAMLGLKPDALSGASFASLFSDRSGAELTESLLTATMADDVQPIEARATRTGKDLRIAPTMFRAGGQRVLMCRLSEACARESALTTDSMARHALSLFRTGSDAMLFLDPKGVIQSANEAFMDLVGAAHMGDVTGRSLAEFMVRGQIDMGLMLGNAERPGTVKVYATQLINQLGGKIAVEVSLTRLEDPQAIGLVVRDATRLEPVRNSMSEGGEMPEASRKVVELVGSATLKEIVSETTDVVEKMCIETAVNLTRNNRVAAAEMLGLSRQSLYVKLRKYGLLNKNG